MINKINLEIQSKKHRARKFGKVCSSFKQIKVNLAYNNKISKHRMQNCASKS